MSPANPRPQELSLDQDGNLSIVWTDSLRRTYTVRQLRDACPCATCREQRHDGAPDSLLPLLSPQDMQPLSIKSMTPVGRYAYNIVFSDGHDSGIYTLEHLHTLGTEPE